MSSFHVDDRVEFKLEFDLAVRLGEFILRHGSVDKQIQALGHRLVAIEGGPAVPAPTRRPFKPRMAESFGEGLS